MWTPRSIDVLKNGPKFVSVCVDFAEENRRIAIFGARTIFIGFALILLQNQNLFFDADSIDVDASIDRLAICTSIRALAWNPLQFYDFDAWMDRCAQKRSKIP